MSAEENRRQGRRLGLWLLNRWPWLVLALGALLPLARVLFDPAGSLPGSDHGDIYKHTWAYWHTIRQIAEGTWPSTPYLNAPNGGVLLDVMVAPALLMMPVTLVGGCVLAANVWLWISLLGVGGIVYLLSLHLTGSRVGATCAGLLAQTAPYLLGHALTSGVHERFAIWVFPLTLLCLIKTRERGGWRWPLAATLGMALAAIQCPTYSVFLAVMILFTLPIMFRLPRDAPYGWRRIFQLGAAYAGMGAALLGVFYLHHWTVLQPNFLAGVPEHRVLLTMGVTAPYADVATVEALFNPFSVRVQEPTRLDDELHNLVYLGWVPLVCLLVGLVAAFRRRARGSLMVLSFALIFGLLSLGPWVLWGEGRVKNPLFYLVSYLVPLYGGVPPLWQQAGVLAMLGMVGVAEVVAIFRRRRWQILLALVLLGAGLGERIWALPIPLVADTFDARVPATYDRINGPGPVLEIPRLWPEHWVARSTMFLAQTRHKQPITAAINLGFTKWDEYRPVAIGISEDWGLTVACMREDKIRWVMVNRPLLAQRRLDKKCLAGLRKAVGPPVLDTKTEVLFDLSKAPAGIKPAKADCP